MNELGFALDSIALDASEAGMPIPGRSRGASSSSSSPPPIFVREPSVRSRTPSVQAEPEDFEAEAEDDEGDYLDAADRAKRLFNEAVRKDDIDDDDVLNDAPPEQLIVYSGQPTGTYEALYPHGAWALVPYHNCEKRGSYAYNISKRAVFILRHNEGTRKNADGSVCIETMLQTIADFGGNSRRKLTLPYFLQCLQRASDKSRFETYNVAGQGVIAIRAIQGHSAVNVSPQLMHWNLFTHEDSPRLYHGTSWNKWRNICKKGIVSGGINKAHGGRHDSFFSPACPVAGRLPRGVVEKHVPYLFDCEVLIEIDTEIAIKKGCQFWHTPGNAVLTKEVVHHGAIICVFGAKTCDTLWRNTPKQIGPGELERGHDTTARRSSSSSDRGTATSVVPSIPEEETTDVQSRSEGRHDLTEAPCASLLPEGYIENTVNAPPIYCQRCNTENMANELLCISVHDPSIQTKKLVRSRTTFPSLLNATTELHGKGSCEA